MDELTLVIQSIIDSELDDLILDLVYDLHSSMKGIPDDQLDLINNGQKMKQSLSSLTQNLTTAIEKQTCQCPHCGQTNIIAVRFAYHLAKCLGVGRRSSRQAKHRIVDQVMTITGSSDDSHSNGDEYLNSDHVHLLVDELGSCTDSNSNRRIDLNDQEYIDEFEYDDEDEDDWKPKKKKRKSQTINANKKSKKKKDDISELDFDNCIIPLDKLCPQTSSHVVLSTNETIYLKTSCPIRSPLNLVEDDQSSTTSIILFHEDSK